GPATGADHLPRIAKVLGRVAGKAASDARRVKGFSGVVHDFWIQVIEHETGEHAVSWILPDGLGKIVQGAGFQACDIVQEENKVAGTVPAPEIVAPGKTEVGTGFHDADGRETLPHEVNGTILRRVVHQHDLKIPEVLGEHRGQAFLQMDKPVVV